MPPFSTRDVLAVDVGSSRVKFGWFPTTKACESQGAGGGLPLTASRLPAPNATFAVRHTGAEAGAWLAASSGWVEELPRGEDAVSLVASVNPGVSSEVEEFLRGKSWAVTPLRNADLPIVIRVDAPERVGIDRLLGAVAANSARAPERPAIVIDMGTAVTVNLITGDGAFQGGAILAGPMTGLAALQRATASLPAVGVEALETGPEVVGKSTVAAMASGAFWGALGAINELLDRMASECDAMPQVFVTGGGSGAFVEHLAGKRSVRHVPHLVLAGIRLVADGLTDGGLGR